ncbi:MAG: GAF domain-containing protein [Anaerolineae bacterium]|nr:GAF domain-containing protein [Anaerolineae bacterium]
MNVKQGRSVHSQIMRRVLPILAGVFAVFAVLGIVVYYNSVLVRLEQEHREQLQARAETIEAVLEKAVLDAERLASTGDVITFAGQARAEVATSNPTLAQSNMLRDFLGVMNANLDLYERIRYVTATGSIWSEVFKRNGVLQEDDTLKLNQLSFDPIFKSSVESSRQTLSIVRLEEDPSGGLPRPVLNLFVPVLSTSEANNVLGTIELTISAQPILQTVNDLQGWDDLRWVLVNSLENYLADSASPPAPGQIVSGNMFVAELPAKDPELGELLAQNPGEVSLVQLNIGTVSILPIQVGSAPDMPWQLILISTSGLAGTGVYGGIAAIIAIVVMGFAMTSVFIGRVLRGRLEPLHAARAMAHQLAEGKIDDTLPPPTGGDEMGQMIDAFKRISIRLHELSSDMEDYQQRAHRNLEIAAKISRETATLAEADDLLNRLIDLICDEFNLYHAQVFLIDDIALNAVLAYSHDGRMMEQKIKILVGSRTVVGQATATLKAIVIEDTSLSNGQPYLPNPSLLDTRSELALPLMVGERVIGALDLHSNRARFFTPDMVRLFQLLADQIAITLQKGKLLAQSEQRLQQSETLNRQLTRGAWQEFEEKAGLDEMYQYDLVDVQPIPDDDDGFIEAISAPITIRGEVIGTIAAVAPEGLPFVEGDHAILRAVADRVGLAIEGARLFQETQSSLAVTSTLYQLSRHLNEADQLEDVIQAVIVSVMSDASGGQIWLFEDYETGTTPEWLTLRADWSFMGRPDKAEDLQGIRLYMPDSIFLSSMRENQVKLVIDMARDRRLDDDLRMIYRRLDARSAVFIPFSARGQWRGVLSIDFPDLREFNDSEERIYNALIDQAGVAIDNRLLIQQTDQSLDQIERLYASSRQINSALNYVDLVRAVSAANTELNLTFELGLMEGELDSTGWPTRVHKVAKSVGGHVEELQDIEIVQIPLTSRLRHREPQIIADASIAPGFNAIFPLFSANQLIALLYLSSLEIGELSEEDYEIYKALAGQMSTVLENRRLLHQTEVALDETRRLYNASRAISTAQDSNAVYRAACEHLAQPKESISQISILLAGPTPSFDAAYFDVVYLWEQTVRLEAMTQPGQRINADAAPFGALMGPSGDAVYFKNLDVELGDQNRLRLALTRDGAVSSIVSSVGSKRRWFGVLIVESSEVNAFDEQYIRYVQAVTDQVAIAVENRMLFDEAQQEAQRALALAEVGQLAARIGEDFERNLSEVFLRVAEPANYDRWYLLLRDADNPELLEKITWQTASEIDPLPDDILNLRTAEHSAADCVRENRMLLVNDPSSYPAFMAYSPERLADVGKHIATPVHVGDEIVGALLVGRGLDRADLDENDEQLVRTLAAQVAVAIDNRRLFRAAETEREYLRSILETMPTGVVVLDAETYLPIQANAQAEALLGTPMRQRLAFNVATYNLIRTGTNVHYPEDEMPIYTAARSGQQSFADDIAVIHADGTQTDLLVNAAPVQDARGQVTNLVVAFQDISNLRGLENALQNNLREQIALYEATRALAEARELDEALDATIAQIMMLGPLDGYIVLLDEETGGLQPARGMFAPEQFNLPEELFQPTPLMISNLEQEMRLSESTRNELIAMGIQAVACIPLRARDTLMGWLVVVYDRVLDFSSDNERFLTTLGDNAAVAIDNRRLFIQTDKALQEARILYETSRALSDASTPDDVVQAAMSQLKLPQVTQVFMAVPLPTNPNAEMMVVVANWQSDSSNNINLLGVTLSPEQFPAWRQVSTETLMTIDNTQTDTRLSELEQMGLMSTETMSLAVLPLRSGNRRIGSIWLGASEPFHHTERDLRIYRSFMEQASLRMEATRLLEQTDRRARQLSTSAQVSQIASSILDLSELMPRVVNLIRESFRYDHVQIFLMDSEQIYAELKASTGEAGKQLLAIKHKLAKGSASVIGTVTATGTPAIALDTADARFVHKPNPYLPLTRSEMALPLIVKGAVAGALDVQSNQPNAFSDEDVEVLKTLAAQISVAIDNARLFDEAQRRARDMSFLFNVTTSAAAPDKSLYESLEDVAVLVRESLDALNVAIYLVEYYEDDAGEMIGLLRAAALTGSSQPLSEVAEIVVGDPQNFIGMMAQDMTARIVTNVEQESRYLPISASARSAVAAPMVAGNQLVGVIALEDDRPNSYDHETVNLMGALTNSLSAIVQNAQLLEQVQKTNDQLRELDRLKSDFLANMSHELRTPLNSIIGFSRVILKGIDGPLTEMQEQDLSTIYNSGTHLLGLINDILDQAKISSGKMDLHSDYFDIKPVVEGVRSIGIGLIKDKPIDLRLEMASGLPKAYGDEFRTRQVLLNLVSNAAKFTQQGGIVIQVYTETDAPTGKPMVRVDVKDTGIGIAEKDMPLLFEAFQQIDSSLTRTVGGTGLGLPIAKSLIEMQGGRMLVSSEVNVGSTFSIVIPMEPTPPTISDTTLGAIPEQPKRKSLKKKTGPLPPRPIAPKSMGTAPLKPLPESQQSKPASGETNGHHSSETLETPQAQDKRAAISMANVMPIKRQILLIEDSPDMVDQYRRVLQREGFDIFAASIALEAEAMASGLRPTLIIMSATFNKGWDILKRLHERDDTRDIPVIVSSVADESAQAAEAGAFSFLPRPFTPDQLMAKVKEAEEDSKTERILIIDDQPESTRLLTQMLDDSGRYRIFQAHSGYEGVSLVARVRPNLVILDLRMPEMDGFAVLDELRANPETASIPVMVVTADTTLNSQERDHLADLTVLFKANLNQENYQEFIDGVKSHLMNGE